jgi:hypothetical protein
LKKSQLSVGLLHFLFIFVFPLSFMNVKFQIHMIRFGSKYVRKVILDTNISDSIFWK